MAAFRLRDHPFSGVTSASKHSLAFFTMEISQGSIYGSLLTRSSNAADRPSAATALSNGTVTTIGSQRSVVVAIPASIVDRSFQSFPLWTNVDVSLLVVAKLSIGDPKIIQEASSGPADRHGMLAQT